MGSQASQKQVREELEDENDKIENFNAYRKSIEKLRSEERWRQKKYKSCA